jgi:hypothetical protein
MNLLYNATDGCALISSNEGWGLSLTDAMMCGKPIIATVTGGMQDQMRFEDEDGNVFFCNGQLKQLRRWPVKQCQRCGMFWNRDVNASRNIFRNSHHMDENDGEMGPAFRPTPRPPEPQLAAPELLRAPVLLQ